MWPNNGQRNAGAQKFITNEIDDYFLAPTAQKYLSKNDFICTVTHKLY